jgi:GTPase involved in cell partitioning and DNA repair
VIGIAANKCDLYDNEQVSEDEARNFANEIGAVFKLTSASTNQGIEDLFKGVGCKVLDPNYSSDDAEKKNKIVLNDDKDKDKNTKKKKGCC